MDYFCSAPYYTSSRSTLAAMAIRVVGEFLAFALLVAAEGKTTRAPVVPTDIIYGTGELIYDIYAAAYSAAEGVANKHGITSHVSNLHKQHLRPLLEQDHLELVCSKVVHKDGVQACVKDTTGHFNKVHATVQQVKAQAYEHGTKGTDFLHGLANTFVTNFETYVPSYKGVLPKNNCVDLLLFIIYAYFVSYIVLRVALFAFSAGLRIFCCVCCCGCCRRGKVAPKNGKNSGKKGADAKAQPGAAKAKAKK